jgi:predicted nuclease of predicted toxin-antitoxin system
MTWLVDESVDHAIADRLSQEDGLTVLYVAELDPGVTDEQVLELAAEEHAYLLTADKDFGELVFRQHKNVRGVLLVRLAGLPPGQKAELVSAAIQAHNDDLEGSFAVITTAGVRIRRTVA